MKKKSFILSIFVFLSLMLYPCVTNAATLGGIFGSTDTNYTSTTMNADESSFTGTISIENNGANTNFYLGIKALASIPSGTVVTATLNMSDSNYAFTRCSTISGSKWTVKCEQDATDSKKVLITATAREAMTTSAKELITQVRVDASGATDSTQPCSIYLSNVNGENPTPENPTCKIVDGKYYDDKGNEVTEAEYKEACENPENPQTGSFIPYAIIIGGIALAGGLYFITKKNKIYHI